MGENDPVPMKKGGVKKDISSRDLPTGMSDLISEKSSYLGEVKKESVYIPKAFTKTRV